MVAIFQSRWFNRFARAERIPASAVREAVNRAEAGLIDADLGGGVIKQRVAKSGQGRSRGYRIVVVFRKSARAFVFYGFAKNRKANLTPAELDQFREAAGHLLGLSARQLEALVEHGDFTEIPNEK